MVKNNLINLEDKFYVNLINNLTKQDSIRINKKFIPKHENNGFIRFFESQNSLWFSRLKNSNEIIYYFGLMNDTESKQDSMINPMLILKFNNDIKKSNLRIFKNRLCPIVKLNDEFENNDTGKFKFKNATKNENSKLKFVILNEIISKDIISSIYDLISKFELNLDLNKNYIEIIRIKSERLSNNITNDNINNISINTSKHLKQKNVKKLSNKQGVDIANQHKTEIKTKYILSVTVNPLEKNLNEIPFSKSENNAHDELDQIVFNSNSISLINRIKNLKQMDDTSRKKLIDFIFDKKDNNDYSFSKNILNYFKKETPDSSYIFYILNISLENTELNIEEYLSEIDSLFNFKLSKNYDNQKNEENRVNTTPLKHINITENNMHQEQTTKIENTTPPSDELIFDNISFKQNNIELEKKLFKYNESDLVNIIIKHKDSIDELKDLTDSQIKKVNFDYNILVMLLFNYLTTEELNSELNNLKEYEIPNIIKENFPLKKPRELQLETISKIYNAIEKGYKYIILEAVSGFGKSVIAKTLSNIYSKEKSYILTPTNQLIAQYNDEFEYNKSTKIKTRSKFNCHQNTKKCNENRCIYSKCTYYKNSDLSKDFNRQSSCRYLYHLKEVQKSNQLITTYYYFLRENFYHSNHLKKRKLLICDESHNLDEKISDSISLNVYESEIEDLLKLDIDKILNEITINEKYYFFLLKIKTLYENKLFKDKKKQSKEYYKYEKRIGDINKFMQHFDKNNSNLVFETSVDRHTKEKILIFKPVKVKKMINDCLLNYGEVSIFMSSSIFDHENFAYDMNLERNKIYSIRVPNIFNLSNPIKIYENFNMNDENIKNGIMKDTLEIIEQILNKHKQEKGIIHTTNRDQTIYLKNNINNSRILNKYFNTREDELEYFKQSDEPLVLVSPSMNEGTNLPGDLCRFQIIYKLPYLPSKDPRIKKRKNTYEDGKEWYHYKMLTRLIQGYGRGIRNEDDYCKTYILDNRLVDIIDEDLDGKNIIPKYFINAIENFNEYWM